MSTVCVYFHLGREKKKEKKIKVEGGGGGGGGGTDSKEIEETGGTF